MLSGFQTTEYREGDELIPVTLRSVEADREDIGKLESLNIFSQISGQSVPLKQVADIEVVWQPSKILRRDRLKTVTVSSQIGGEITALAIFDQLDVWLEQADDDWPLGYRWEFGGEFEASVEANESIGVKLPDCRSHHPAPPRGPVQLAAAAGDHSHDDPIGTDRRRHRPAAGGLAHGVHDVSRHHFAERHRHQ